MAKRKGNPNWGNFGKTAESVETKTAFEQFVTLNGIAPEQFERSTRLRAWAKKHKDHRYIPEHLLEVWGMTVSDRLSPFKIGLE